MDKAREHRYYAPVPLDKLPKYDGLLLPGFPRLMADPVKEMTGIRDFKSQDTDILICTFPKSGTHWISEIVEQLIAGKAEYSTKSKGTLFLEVEVSEEFEATECSRPRNLNSHLPFRMLPKRHIELKAKIIHVIRNPKDVAVSWFHHSQKDPFAGAVDMPWSEFLERYTQKNGTPYSTWFEYEKDWEQIKKDNPNLNILTLYYEDMKENIEAEIKKVADFLGVSYTEDLIKHIAVNVDFKHQSKAKFDISQMYSVDKQPFVYRKGEVGDWKNWFTVAQNEKFDALYQNEMKDSNLKIKSMM